MAPAGPGVEHAGRLRRPVLLRPCAVLRHRRLRGRSRRCRAAQPLAGLPLAIAAAALVGAFVGALSFRYGLKGSYFALVTLAFAEVFRILALSVPFTGAGVGLMVPLREGIGEHAVRATGAAIVGWRSARGRGGLLVTRVAAPLALRRLAAGGARQRGRGRAPSASIRFRVKLGAIGVSGALMGAGGAFYVQVFQYIDPGIAYRARRYLGGGAGGGDRRRPGHAVGPGARRGGAAPAGRPHAQPVRRPARASTW